MPGATELKATLLADASTETARQFAKLFAAECAIEELQQSGHRCHFFIPSPSEYAQMAPFFKGCPKCNLAVEVQVFHGGGLGDSFKIKCCNAKCDWTQQVEPSDD